MILVITGAWSMKKDLKLENRKWCDQRVLHLKLTEVIKVRTYQYSADETVTWFASIYLEGNLG
jgi:hypothetical protein